ncbi:MAG: glycosyltransferase family 1 protein [Candidatus Omnitrophota bacterium]
MNIAVDVRSTLKKTKTGIGVYASNIINAFSAVDKEDTFLLYSKVKPFDRKRKLPDLPAKNFCHRVNYFNFPLRSVLGRNVDVLYTLSYDLKPSKGMKFVLVVCDIIPKVWPYGHTDDVLRNFDTTMKIIQYADAIITISHSTHNDLIAHYDVPKEKVFMIYPGVDTYFRKIDIGMDEKLSFLSKFNIKENFILNVGTIEPRKNLKNLLIAFKEVAHKINHQLVVVGMKGWMYQEVLSQVETLELSDRVIMPGYISNEELLMFFNLSDIFIYPSFYEGFGFPVAEAFRCKVPVITSRTSALKEIAEGVSLLVDPREPASISEALENLCNNKGLQDELAQKAYARSLEFDWLTCAAQTLAVFRKVMEH